MPKFFPEGCVNLHSHQWRMQMCSNVCFPTTLPAECVVIFFIFCQSGSWEMESFSECFNLPFFNSECPWAFFFPYVWRPFFKKTLFIWGGGAAMAGGRGEVGAEEEGEALSREPDVDQWLWGPFIISFLVNCLSCPSPHSTIGFWGLATQLLRVPYVLGRSAVCLWYNVGNIFFWFVTCLCT